MPQDSKPSASKFDPTQDRYATAHQAFRLLLDQGSIPDVPIERLEATCLANGEVTYRYWELNAEEPDGGVLRLHG